MAVSSSFGESEETATNNPPGRWTPAIEPGTGRESLFTGSH